MNDANIVDKAEKGTANVPKRLKKKFKHVFNYTDRNIYKIIIILLIGLLLISILNITNLAVTDFAVKERARIIKEFNEPSKIQLYVIDCEGCFDVSPIVDSIKGKNVNVTKEESLNPYSDESKNLIEEYEIENLPSILILGEIDDDKISFNNFKPIKDALVLDKISPPYLDLKYKRIRGKVTIKEILDSSCDDCIPLAPIAESLAQAGVFIEEWEKIEYNSAEGKGLISKFGVKKVPAVLISEDIDYYEEIKQSLSQLNLTKKNRFYALHSTLPPYRDLAKNKIVGLVELIMITDNSCSDCYDVNVNKQILQRFGIKIKDENTYDASSPEGENLISKYSIEKVPIIILSPEAEEYSSFVSAWKSIGTEESDGWFIMRKPEMIGIVKNLATGQMIER